MIFKLNVNRCKQKEKKTKNYILMCLIFYGLQYTNMCETSDDWTMYNSPDCELFTKIT